MVVGRQSERAARDGRERVRFGPGAGDLIGPVVVPHPLAETGQHGGPGLDVTRCDRIALNRRGVSFEGDGQPRPDAGCDAVIGLLVDDHDGNGLHQRELEPPHVEVERDERHPLGIGARVLGEEGGQLVAVGAQGFAQRIGKTGLTRAKRQLPVCEPEGNPQLVTFGKGDSESAGHVTLCYYWS